MLHYYMHIPDPRKLSDTEWSVEIAALLKIRKMEAGEHDVIQQMIKELTGS